MAESSKKKRTAVPKARKKPLTAAKKVVRKRVVFKKAAKVALRGLEHAAVPVEHIKSEDSKFYVGPVIQKLIDDRGFELPQGYSDCRITLLVRDPYWIYSYWELPDWKLEEMKSLIGHSEFSRAKKILRVYDVSGINFTGMNANKSFDIHLTGEAKNWYVKIGEPNRSWCIDIGFLTADGKFYIAARSNIISTPRDGMSDEIDEEWMTIDWEKIYALSGGFGLGRSSGEIKELLKRRLHEELSSGITSSFMKKNDAQDKDFWLVASTELIVYGATEPTAKLTVQGLPVKLRADGTFTLRFALPDGRQEIPIVAKNAQGDMKRSITKVVEKRTQ